MVFVLQINRFETEEFLGRLKQILFKLCIFFEEHHVRILKTRYFVAELFDRFKQIDHSKVGGFHASEINVPTIFVYVSFALPALEVTLFVNEADVLDASERAVSAIFENLLAVRVCRIFAIMTPITKPSF